MLLVRTHIIYYEACHALISTLRPPLSLYAAAAGVTVDDFVAELDIPIPGLDKIQPWIPKLNVGGDSSGENTALQVSLCSE